MDRYRFHRIMTSEKKRSAMYYALKTMTASADRSMEDGLSHHMTHSTRIHCDVMARVQEAVSY